MNAFALFLRFEQARCRLIFHCVFLCELLFLLFCVCGRYSVILFLRLCMSIWAHLPSLQSLLSPSLGRLQSHLRDLRQQSQCREWQPRAQRHRQQQLRGVLRHFGHRRWASECMNALRVRDHLVFCISNSSVQRERNTVISPFSLILFSPSNFRYQQQNKSSASRANRTLTSELHSLFPTQHVSSQCQYSGHVSVSEESPRQVAAHHRHAHRDDAAAPTAQNQQSEGQNSTYQSCTVCSNTLLRICLFCPLLLLLFFLSFFFFFSCLPPLPPWSCELSLHQREYAQVHAVPHAALQIPESGAQSGDHQELQIQ